MSFYDTDKEIEEAAGASIAWIFDVEGEKNLEIENTKYYPK